MVEHVPSKLVGNHFSVCPVMSKLQQLFQRTPLAKVAVHTCKAQEWQLKQSTAPSHTNIHLGAVVLAVTNNSISA